MRSRRGLGLLLFSVVIVLGSSSPAQAWTRTVVKGAKATVEVEHDATLSVLLRLDIEVQAGWLQEIELAELGAGVELDRHAPPYFRSDEGQIFRPEAVVQDDGLIRLSFSRRDAPRQGEYRLVLKYRTTADVGVAGNSRARIVWSLPAWETGLHDVSVEFRAPKGATVPTELHETPPGVELHVAEHPDGTIIQWHRIHLPRMSAWSLTLDVPVGSIALPVDASATPEPEGFRSLTIPKERPIAWSLLLLAGVALLKRRSIELRAGRAELLIRVSWVNAFLVTATVVAIGQWLAASYLACALALIALSLRRPSRLTGRTEAPAWDPISVDALPARDPAASDLLDATTVVGSTVMLIGGAFLVAVGQPLAALLLLPLFSLGTRLHMAPTVGAQADALRGFAKDLRLGTDAPAVSLSWELSSDGIPRLRVHLPTERAGLISLGFVVASSSLGGVARNRVMLLIETRAQSDADDVTRRRTNREPALRASDGRILRLLEWNADAVGLLATLARETPQHMEPSRGTWLLREISEPRRKAA